MFLYWYILVEMSKHFTLSVGQKNNKSKKNQAKRNAAKKMTVSSFGDPLFDKVYQIMEKHKEVNGNMKRNWHG